jgi:2-amino-4-hydroxy-6-hydroxymethyldihydropteridine diphosphokinase
VSDSPRAALAFVALGSNLGDRDAHLDGARRALDALPGCRVLASSRVDETAPLGGLAQPPYLNQMLALSCELAPRALLDAMQDIEERAGRTRAERWGSRTLDLDLVLFDDVTSDDPTLRLPHPGLADRDFWQRELAELREVL